MEKLDFTESNLSHLITHFVGNKAKGQTLEISKGLTEYSVENTELIQQFFFDGMKLEEYFTFFHKESLDMHPVMNCVQNIFTDQSQFIEQSENLARLLYDSSVHPKVIDGEFSVCYITNIKIGEQYVNAIGMFKSESLNTFFKYDHQGSHYKMSPDYGYDISKLDKGCLVFEVNEEDGYDVIICDRKAGGEEAIFWKETFLGLKPIENNYFQTKVAMELTKSFVDSSAPEEMQMSIADQIAMLNKTNDYFKKNDQFERGSFEEAVFGDEDIAAGFQAYEQKVGQAQNLQFPSNFEISKPAVKKTSKIFRSILKLDKNFSIYIHGDRDRAEKGEDEKGRFYKFYYDTERFE
jgi:hypothetical protein